ncbi:tetratricopeptide repeat protein [Oscillatoria sp. CS-180]|uniref:tetratricopeptide repeat protein n=1 Tax=Oscillatoria sp. CS-180 TaxID=3021720 RepID=UPI002330B6A4|nr:tetratricopeptide repeat protein [Oscillatoria sp. CS-180]MDB9528371.1 tetratricopeptide repeat protein [Oscillatoria sp. CS-180]
MNADAVLELADSLVFNATGRHLSDLQRKILKDVWRRQTYSQIARRLRYTEGHIKDVASQIWQALSQSLDERVTKSNSLSVLERYLHKAKTKLTQFSLDSQSHAGDIRLVGRESAIKELNQHIAQGQRAIVLHGEGGIGKTTLAQAYLERCPCDRVLELLIAKETANITPAEQVVEEWLRQDFQIEPGQDFGVTLDRLKRQLRDQRVGILIDNLEPALDAQGRFWPQHSRYGDLMRVLCDPKGKTVTLLTSRDRLCEPGVTVTHYRLPGLTQDTWRLFFDHHAIALSSGTLKAMHRAYGGNAKAMTILCGAIGGDYAGDGDAYWRDVNADPLTALDLKNLVTSQINHLKDLDMDAYRLFCRLGVFRYQDVARVPTDGLLALMWDSDPTRHRQIITSLRNRSLVESHKGTYWLHPVVHAEALERLRHSADYSKAHTQAIQFWTHHIATIASITEATQAFEAYHHAFAIADYEAAAAVLLNSRHNQWGQHLTLGSTLYRVGLLQPVITSVPRLLPHLPEDQRTSELRNILADAYWISGKIHAAISMQKQAQAIARQGLEVAQQAAADDREIYRWRMVEVDALLSLGLYHLDLWELTEAAQFFQAAIAAAEGTPQQSWAEKASLCLALVQSYQTADRTTPRSPTPPSRANPTSIKTATALAETAYQKIADVSQPQYTGRFAFFIQLLAQTYTNLHNAERANELYERAIAFAEESHYVQVKAKALTGLGQLLRSQGEFSGAVQHLNDAIVLFEDLGAQSDLAETHYQLGLTLQHRQADTAQAHFTKAVHLFEAIQAPRQVTKVQSARREKG